jgi:hypothetical protein
MPASWQHHIVEEACADDETEQDANRELGNLLLNAWVTRPAPPAVIPFLSNQSLVPTQDRVRRHDRPDLAEDLPAQALSLDSETPAFIIGEANPRGPSPALSTDEGPKCRAPSRSSANGGPWRIRACSVATIGRLSRSADVKSVLPDYTRRDEVAHLAGNPRPASASRLPPFP